MKQLKLKEAESIQPIDLKEELRKRFLWYAISTIASRALPDVRDGLKPVHRRIIYAMYRMRLLPDQRYRKSAAVVGDVLGKYHPHGDQAAYDTLVRLAQEFSLRYPLIDGQGNFGSIDGDSAAAMRYTEAKLTPMAIEIIREIDQETVPFRPNYDSTIEEPLYLPSRVPNLLINGSSGIAVGMATNIPPHNISETINALTALIDEPKLSTAQIMKYIKGPDFPTGATMLVDKKEISRIYETGKGSVKIRGEYNIEEHVKGKKQIVITSLPYTVNKAKLIERIAQIIIGKKIAAFYDIRDESDEKIRVVIEVKGEIDINKAMGYVYKYTDLEYAFAVNMTALDVNNAPRRMPLLDMLNIFLKFRIETTQKRFEFRLGKINERLHILSALLKVLKGIDKAIAIIRKSKSRDEAKAALKKSFKLDEMQVTAVLDLRLSSLVAMEIAKVRKEAAELEAERKDIESILQSKGKKKLKLLVKKELIEIKKEYGDKRRTKIEGGAVEEEEYSAADFIQHEECYAIISRNGWIRRVRKEPNVEQLRFKEGDKLLDVYEMDTVEHVAFFSSAGKVYVTTAFDFPQTTGFGDPIQSLFKFGDGEKLVTAMPVKHIASGEKVKGEYLVIMENGNGFRFAADTVTETTRAGKKFANVKGGNAVLDVVPVEKPYIYAAGSGGKGLLFSIKDVPVLSGAGGGVRLLKLKGKERVIGIRSVGKKDKLRLAFDQGRDVILKISELEIGSRATTGRSYGGLKKNLIAVLEE
jgi:DNA gyrase subunit A